MLGVWMIGDLYWFESVSQAELLQLAGELTTNNADAVAQCVEFICVETRGHWHGRARAMMCRRLKHCVVNPVQRSQLVACITGRLGAGNFSEQFVDQLRLALYLDHEATVAAARTFLAATPKDHVRRYCRWVLQHRQA